MRAVLPGLLREDAVLGDAVEGSGRAAEHGPQSGCFSS